MKKVGKLYVFWPESDELEQKLLQGQGQYPNHAQGCLNLLHGPIARASLHDIDVNDTEDGHDYLRKIAKSPFARKISEAVSEVRDVADVKAGAEDKPLRRQLMI